MTLKSDLPDGPQISIHNRVGQTHIALSSRREGSSQSQANSFSTGEWKEKPSLFQTSDGLILQVEAEQETFFFSIQGNSIQRLQEEPSLQDADTIALHESDEAPEMRTMEPMKPMEPLKPLKPMG